MVTISDVAAHAGVGVSTVSRVLNESPKVSADTRARVLAAIEALSYRPNPLARGLSRGRCQTLGVVVPFFTHASAVERLRGVVAALDGSRYDLVLFNVESPVHRDEHFAAIDRDETGPTGCWCCRCHPLPADLVRLDRRRRAGGPRRRAGQGVDMVVTDDVEGGRHGARSTSWRWGTDASRSSVRTPTIRSASPRARSVKRATARCSPKPGSTRLPNSCATGRTTAPSRNAWPTELFAQRSRPTAVFASSDVQATGVLAAAPMARSAGTRRPVGRRLRRHRDLRRYAGLTTVRQPLFESGTLGCRLLLDAAGREATRLPPIVTGAPARARRAIDDRRPTARCDRTRTHGRNRASTTSGRSTPTAPRRSARSTSTSPTRSSWCSSGRPGAARRPRCGWSRAWRSISPGTVPIGDRVVNDVAAEGPRHRDGVPELRAVPAHERVRQHGVRPQAAEAAEGEDRRACARRGAHPRARELLERKPKALSGGQRQRVAMGRAIVRHPQAFLMDEPLSNLDAKLRVQMRSEIARIQTRPRRHDDLRHPRPDRGDDDGRPRRRAPQGRCCSRSTRRRCCTSTR